nr:MAG TPA: hypothetical protein [Caudoviricetes sp.]
MFSSRYRVIETLIHRVGITTPPFLVGMLMGKTEE